MLKGGAPERDGETLAPWLDCVWAALCSVICNGSGPQGTGALVGYASG